jgi:hypothetical protein
LEKQSRTLASGTGGGRGTGDAVLTTLNTRLTRGVRDRPRRTGGYTPTLVGHVSRRASKAIGGRGTAAGFTTLIAVLAFVIFYKGS